MLLVRKRILRWSGWFNILSSHHSCMQKQNNIWSTTSVFIYKTIALNSSGYWKVSIEQDLFTAERSQRAWLCLKIPVLYFEENLQISKTVIMTSTDETDSLGPVSSSPACRVTIPPEASQAIPSRIPGNTHDLGLRCKTCSCGSAQSGLRYVIPEASPAFRVSGEYMVIFFFCVGFMLVFKYDL